MNIILLSGGSGVRLWPLSNEVRSKQFLKIFTRPDGSCESMVQRVYRQIRAADPEAAVTVATSKSQVSALRNQLGEEIGISVEPCRRDTFPAIALACAYLYHVRRVSPREPVVVCPVDPYVEDGYFSALGTLADQAAKGEAKLVLMGIAPTYPSEKYGYILPQDSGPISAVSSFREKPDLETARALIARGALWNGGVFAFRLEYLLEKAHQLLDFTDYQDLLSRYDRLSRISFDYAVAEKEPSIQVVRYVGSWKDLGTWNTLTEAMGQAVTGPGILNETCENVHIVNELNLPVVCMGLKDTVVAVSADGVLVSAKEQSSYIKPIVEHLNKRTMFAEKSWGSYRVLSVEPSSQTILVTLNPGHRMHYHSHRHRSEIWTVISGQGIALVDDVPRQVGPGDVVRMDIGCRHTIAAQTELKVIEVQLGEEITVQDKQKYPLDIPLP